MSQAITEQPAWKKEMIQYSFALLKEKNLLFTMISYGKKDFHFIKIRNYALSSLKTKYLQCSS